MVRLFSTCAVAAVFLAGCMSSQDTFGTQVRAQSSQFTAIADQWDRGNAMILEGQALIERGTSDVRDGRRLVDRGEARQREGRELVRRGEAQKMEAEAAHVTLNPGPAS